MKFLGGDKTISRQRRWQERKAKLGLCTICGKKAFSGGVCLMHLVYRREFKRKELGLKKRYLCCPTYQAEKRRKRNV